MMATLLIKVMNLFQKKSFGRFHNFIENVIKFNMFYLTQYFLSELVSI